MSRPSDRYLGSRCLQDEPDWASMDEPPEREDNEDDE